MGYFDDHFDDFYGDDSDDYGFSGIDCYHLRHCSGIGSFEVKTDPRKVEPALVTAVTQGDLSRVIALVGSAVTDAERRMLVNASKIWTEEDYKSWGVKTWEWHGDTALIAAARGGHHAIVRYLLCEGLADPTLMSCPKENFYCKALDVAECRVTRALLQAAESHWAPPVYAHARCGYNCRRCGDLDNVPLNVEDLRAALKHCSLIPLPDADDDDDLGDNVDACSEWEIAGIPHHSELYFVPCSLKVPGKSEDWLSRCVALAQQSSHPHDHSAPQCFKSLVNIPTWCSPTLGLHYWRLDGRCGFSIRCSEFVASQVYTELRSKIKIADYHYQRDEGAGGVSAAWDEGRRLRFNHSKQHPMPCEEELQSMVSRVRMHCSDAHGVYWPAPMHRLNN
eukprot:gnl/MRDRNA2_/MRDRNA2_165705_c0_seq1.p1 gnl/MRDRNA2_/MRDRNA2_165705_c0~~gnl/MRDRNA2_/MRDRNA2_165705_c0_seq1.p1  ORF type:complete len:393 (-),score=60.31 gnl/MRDRNA2_/MRDRNA2_165705_c0_seq1:205-1383(-)